MSGSATAQWDIPQHQMELAKKQAQLLGCADNSVKQILQCLKQASQILQLFS